MSTVRERLSSAHVISIIALGVALSAGAYAASLPRNSVKSATVKDESLRGKDVKKDTLTGDDVSEASLGQVPSAQSAQTAASAANATDATNAANANLLDNLNSTEFLSSAPGSVGPASLAAMPGARALATIDQTINSGGGSTLVALDSELFDTGAMYTPPANELIAARTGSYVITGWVTWDDTDNDPDRQINLVVAGDRVASVEGSPGGIGTTSQIATTVARATAGDAIQLQARQTSGSALTFSEGGPQVRFAGLAAQWLGP